MSPPDAALLRRLEALTGDDPACCVDDLRALAAAARDDRFDATLRKAKALADENRLLVATLLSRRGEMCACELQAALDVTHATVSHHMDVLVDAGLVESERRGKWVYYRLRDPAGLIP